MNRNLTKSLILSAAVGAVLSTAATAQEAALEEIIVTARRVEEKIQDVPISMTVFNQQQLTNLNVVSYKDLAAYTPSLTVNTRYGSDNTSFTIRGFTQEQRTTPTVAVYFADVVAPRGGGTYPGGDGAGPGSFFDLQNVQTLKGPQGTLFGRNTTGGAVLLVPRKPSDSFDGYVEVSGGDYNMRRAQGVVNVPVTDSFRLRLGGDWQMRDGFLDNISNYGPTRMGDVHYAAGRLSAVWDITDTLENYFIGSYTHSESNGVVPKVTRCNTATSFGGLSCPQIARAASRDFWTVENTLGAYASPLPVSSMEQWQAIDTTSWKVTPALTVKNIVSYAELESTLRADLFGTNWTVGGNTMTFVPIFALPDTNRNNDQSTFTEELQFQGNLNADQLVWQAGLYFEKSKPLGATGVQNPSLMFCADPYNFQCRDLIGAGAGREGRVGSMSRAVLNVESKNMAAYAQGSYAITDQFKLTMGLRYTEDKVEGTAVKNTIRFPSANNPVVYCVDPSMGYPTGPIGADFSNALSLSQKDLCRRYDSNKTSAPTWLVDLDYKPVGGLLIYGKYARGYRQGNISPLAADGFTKYDAEKVDSYEIGSKLLWSGAVPGNFNVAVFYNDFTDQQLQLGVRSSTNSVAPGIAVFNAGKSRIQGAEVESTLMLVDGLHFNVSYAYLDSKLLEFVQPTVTAGGAYDTVDSVIVGEELPFAIKSKVSTGLDYELPLPESLGAVSVGAVYTHQSRYLTGYTGNAEIPAFSLVNANLNWKSIMNSPIDVSLFVTNVTNKEYFTHVNDQYTASGGFLSYYLGEPRMFGVRVKASFGK